MNVILHIIYLGGIYIMWDVLFNENPVGRSALFTVIGIIIFFIIYFFAGYAYSLFFDGNFMFVAMLE